MADLRRLGKPGSYRLGGRRSRARPGWSAAIVVAGAAVIAVTAHAGLWFMPFVVGVAAGLAGSQAGWRAPGWRGRCAPAAVLVMAAAGWGAPLVWQTVAGEPVGATARVVAALAGLPPDAVVGVVLALLVACLQAAVGRWLGSAVRPRAWRV
jgi:hypothetical protein